MSSNAVEASVPVKCHALKIHRAKCFTYGCSFEVRGDTAEAEGNAHISVTNHQMVQVSGELRAFLVRPRPPQRVLQDAAETAETVDAVRDLFREASELNVLDAEVHDALGTRSLRTLLTERAKELEPAAGAIA